MNKAEAKKYVGLTKVSKMPCLTFNLPALTSCPRGKKLAEVKGTVCSGCYATKGFFKMPSVRNAQARNLERVAKACTRPALAHNWVEAFTRAMRGETYFRWHSSGDIFNQGYADLMRKAILSTPWVKHWIPTKEGRYSKMFEDLDNATFRVSNDMLDQTTKKYPVMSGVSTGAYSTCPAPNQNGECRSCRKCWDKTDPLVIYKQH